MTSAEYDAAVAECDALNDACPEVGTPAARRLVELGDMIEAYEDGHAIEFGGPNDAPLTWRLGDEE